MPPGGEGAELDQIEVPHQGVTYENDHHARVEA